MIVSSSRVSCLIGAPCSVRVNGQDKLQLQVLNLHRLPEMTLSIHDEFGNAVQKDKVALVSQLENNDAGVMELMMLDGVTPLSGSRLTTGIDGTCVLPSVRHRERKEKKKGRET